jgi:nucleoside 2-deoxyribosyltransferase
MKITLIGSTQYRDRFLSLKADLESQGHEVKIPAFDDHKDLDDLGVCEYNRSLIEWADEVHMIWDRRSTGTIFDFGMTFALRKPFKIEYLEPKTFENVMKKYEVKSCQ